MTLSKESRSLGVRRNKALCPIALELWWRVPGHKEIGEDGTVIVYAIPFRTFPVPGHPGYSYRRQVPNLKAQIARFTLPPEAVLWIKNYDERGDAPDLTFEVEVPEIGGENEYAP